MKDIVYVNNNVIGYFEEDTYLQYSKQEKELNGGMRHEDSVYGNSRFCRSLSEGSL